jgi:hypothetical protein
LRYNAADTFNGGAGKDRLEFRMDETELDLSTLTLTDMEIISLYTAKDFQFNLSIQDVINVTDGNNQLEIWGQAHLTSTGEGWTQEADQVIDGQTYNTYTGGGATLLVDTDITQDIS